MGVAEGGCTMDSSRDALREREVLVWLNQRVSAADWRLLGTNLGLSGSLLRQIRANHQDVEDRLWMVVHYWLREAYNTDEYGTPSWTRLKNAIPSTSDPEK